MNILNFHRTVMERPFLYVVYDTIGKRFENTDDCPILHQLQTYQPTPDPRVFELRQTKVSYIDMRYDAKIRLYNYLLKRNGVDISTYKPFAGTEIGISIPILNF